VKKKKRFGILFLLIFVLFLWFGFVDFKPASSTTLERIPLDSWVYSAIDQLYVQGFFQKLHKNSKPYTRGQIAGCLLEIDKRVENGKITPSSDQGWLLKKLNLEFRYEMEALTGDGKRIKYQINPLFYHSHNSIDTSWTRGKLFLDGAFQFNKRLVLKDRILLDTKAEKDRNIYGKEWKKDLTGVFDQSYVEFDFKHLSVFLGRDYLRWGPGKEDFLLLSGFSPPFDMLKLESKFGRFKFLFFATSLDDITHLNVLYKRYLSGHRIDFKPFSWLELGASEVIVYGGEKRNYELYYLNPLLLYYGVQWNQGYDDNPLWNFDFSFTRLKNIEVYGEFLIDDFQYDFESEPHQIGFRLGAFFVDLFSFKRTFVNLEYERINNWVYGQNKPQNLYTFHDVVMGSFLGTDADRIYFDFLYHFSYAFKFGLKGEYKRKGGGKVDLHPQGTVPKTEFPSGIVEYTKKISLESTYQPDPHLLVVGEVGYNRVDNFQNKDNQDTENFFFRIRLGYNFWKEKKF